MLLQEILRVNPQMRATADRLADAGFRVITPDLFWQVPPHVELGYGEAEFEAAHEVYRQFRFDDGLAAIAASLADARRGQSGRGKIDALGFHSVWLGDHLMWPRAAVPAHASVDSWTAV